MSHSEESHESVNYEDAGVSTWAGAKAVEGIKDIVRSTYSPQVVGDLGGFGGLFSLAEAKTMDDPLLVSGADGVGTKLEIARLCNKHTTVGIDLVAMCVNDVLATGAKPLYFLDYIAAGKIEPDAIKDIVSGIVEGCKQAHCSLIGGEMAEHPGVMKPSEYDLAGFCTGIVDRKNMLDPEDVVPGDMLIALPSSGLHSNGFSLVRKVCIEGKSLEELNKPLALLEGKNLLEALIVPTKIYVDPLLRLLKRVDGGVRSLAHITGGGITENLNRALNSRVDALIDPSLWSVPPVVSYVCNAAHLSQEEAFKTFNMGLGMVLVVPADKYQEVTACLRSMDEACVLIGEVVPGSGEVKLKERAPEPPKTDHPSEHIHPYITNDLNPGGKWV